MTITTQLIALLIFGKSVMKSFSRDFIITPFILKILQYLDQFLIIKLVIVLHDYTNELMIVLACLFFFELLILHDDGFTEVVSAVCL